MDKHLYMTYYNVCVCYYIVWCACFGNIRYLVIDHAIRYRVFYIILHEFEIYSMCTGTYEYLQVQTITLLF